MSEIIVWDRRAGREFREQVFGDAMVKFFYASPPGLFLADRVVTRPWLSKAVGAYQSSRLSRGKIASFVRDFAIPMEEYEPASYHSFNDFFTRTFRKEARTFVADPRRMPAFAEARYLAYAAIGSNETFPVKGDLLDAKALLGPGETTQRFVGGPLLLARLCPVDYHRFHYPDDGRTVSERRIPGLLHSVNPLALKARPDVFAVNERHVSILATQNFGQLAYIEVGALCVGRIVQTHPVDQPFRRGDEKGMFLFGASTVIVIGEPGRWRPSADLLEQTAQRRETLVRLGDEVAVMI